jgi:peptide/nickel transport system substrate-binding protein
MTRPSPGHTEPRRPGRAAVSIAAVAAAVVVLTACGSGGSTGAATSGTGSAAGSSGGAPKAGGTLTFAVSSDAKCVDPQQVGSNDAIYSARQLVDSLTDQDPATGKIVPWLAEKWQISPDATGYTFTLRKGVTFSDGTPLDAAAVKATFDAVPRPASR